MLRNRIPSLFPTVVALAAITGAVQAQVPVSGNFTYQGRLELNGIPLAATADFRFSLWTQATGGAQAGSTISSTATPDNGLFTVELDFGVNALNGDKRWLQIEVRSPAGSGSYSTLAPRQPLNGAPYAIQTRGIFVDPAKRVGIGTTTPAEMLHVSGGNFVLDRGGSTSSITRTLTIGGARDINGTDYAQLDFRNYDQADLATDYVGARISSRNEGSSDDGDLRFSLATDGVLQQRMLISSAGNVGIGTSAPASRLEVVGNIATTTLSLDGTIRRGGTTPATTDLGLYSLTEGNWLRIVTNNAPIQFFTDSAEGTSTTPAANSPALTIAANGDVGIGTHPGAKLDVAGIARVDMLQIDGGADLAENFDVAPATHDAAMVAPQPGMVVRIDAAQIGKLVVADQAYDRRVAGIISGAGDVRPAVTLGQPGTAADGEHPVASVGRVWCWADADAGGAIEAGDLLTTSSTPGHAMRAGDPARTAGACIGKAMSPLKQGRGLVLVLVSLQ
jgi:hypothetical protein